MNCFIKNCPNNIVGCMRENGLMILVAGKKEPIKRAICWCGKHEKELTNAILSRDEDALAEFQKKYGIK